MRETPTFHEKGMQADKLSFPWDKGKYAFKGKKDRERERGLKDPSCCTDLAYKK